MRLHKLFTLRLDSLLIPILILFYFLVGCSTRPTQTGLVVQPGDTSSETDPLTATLDPGTFTPTPPVTSMGKLVGMLQANNSSNAITISSPWGWRPFPYTDNATVMKLKLTVKNPQEVYLLMGTGRYAQDGGYEQVGLQVKRGSEGFDNSTEVQHYHLGGDQHGQSGCTVSAGNCAQFFASGWGYFTGYPAGEYTVYLVSYSPINGQRSYVYDRQLLIYQLM